MGSEHSPHRILVTGGAGFIGSHLVRHLLASDANVEIVNLDLLTYAGDLGRLQDLEGHPRLRHVIGDICDRELVSSLLGEPETRSVIHLAAESHVDRSISGPAEFVRTNVVGTFTLLEACRDAWLSGRPREEVDFRFHHVSTDEVFGELGPSDDPFREDTPYFPNSPYSASKAGSDHLVRAYHRTYGLPMVLTNCSNNYGPAQHDEKFIPTVIRSCLGQIPIPIYGDGSNVRDWLFVEDHCDALERVLRRGRLGETYLIGGGAGCSNMELARLICGLIDELRPEGAPHERLLTYVPDRPGHDWRYATDPTRIKDQLGWRPRESLESGMRRTVQWYLARHDSLSNSGGAASRGSRLASGQTTHNG